MMRIRRLVGVAKSLAVCCALFSVLLLQGCWDEVNLADVTYISTIGIEYKEESFQIYALMLKFSDVAKTESAPQQPSEVWIGTGKGDSIFLAINDLKKSAQSDVSLEHLKIVVVQDSAMGKLDEVLDGLNRQRASRYTSTIFGTRSDFEKLFTTEALFEHSLMNTIMYLPNIHERQRSFIRPYEMQLAVQSFNEPAMTTTLPVIDYNETKWKKGKKKMRVQQIAGVFVIKEKKYIGYLSENEAKGLRWYDPDFELFMLQAEGKTGQATIAVNRSHYKLRVETDKGRPAFRLQVNLKGSVVEQSRNITEREIEQSIESAVKEEMTDTNEIGLKKGMDLYRLEHQMYRYNQPLWKKEAAGGDWLPRPDQLDIEVNFQLTHTGKLNLE